MRKHMQSSFIKQVGFTLIELMIVLGIIGLMVGSLLVYQSRASSNSQTKDMITAVSNMASKIRTYYQAQGTYNGLSASAINGMALVTSPLTWDGTNIRDAWGNAMQFVGNASGAAPSFVITIGGTTSALDKEACTGMTTGLGNAADVVQVGASTAITTTNGLAGGGSAYKTSSGTISVSNMTTGCGATNPVIALQYH
jgi:prepilin-type N-terminal cleavage/methylation domain-containing protein